MVEKARIAICLLLLSGCGGAHLTEIESCIPEVSIESTGEVEFYFKEAGNEVRVSYLRNRDSDDNYLCFNNLKKIGKNSCDYDFHGEIEIRRLPTGSIIKFDGFAAKTVKWGIVTMNTGPSPMTFFRGEVENRVIWVSSFTLVQMFKYDDNFVNKNIDVVETLNMANKIPNLIIYDSNNSPTRESWERYREQTKSIQEWDCDLRT